MAKKRKQPQAARRSDSNSNAETPQGATLKELLGADVIGKLKAQADELKQAEVDLKESQRRQAEEERKQEQKRKENDFAYLLDNSDSNWSKYK